jgi:hypothetical protein
MDIAISFLGAATRAQRSIPSFAKAYQSKLNLIRLARPVSKVRTDAAIVTIILWWIVIQLARGCVPGCHIYRAHYVKPSESKARCDPGGPDQLLAPIWRLLRLLFASQEFVVMAVVVDRHMEVVNDRIAVVDCITVYTLNWGNQPNF